MNNAHMQQTHNETQAADARTQAAKLLAEAVMHDWRDLNAGKHTSKANMLKQLKEQLDELLCYDSLVEEIEAEFDSQLG